jgi:hypothetical protein
MTKMGLALEVHDIVEEYYSLGVLEQIAGTRYFAV